MLKWWVGSKGQSDEAQEEQTASVLVEATLEPKPAPTSSRTKAACGVRYAYGMHVVYMLELELPR